MILPPARMEGHVIMMLLSALSVSAWLGSQGSLVRQTLMSVRRRVAQPTQHARMRLMVTSAYQCQTKVAVSVD